MKPKQLGMAIIILSIIVIGLMISFIVQLDKQQLEACTDMCGQEGGDACTIDSCPLHKGRNAVGWIPILASIMVAGLGGMGIYLLFSKEEKIINQKEYDLTKLNEMEKKIFHLVKESPGEIYQSEIVTKLELSKVQTTRILDKLERKGFIERKRRGMTNMVSLK